MITNMQKIVAGLVLAVVSFYSWKYYDYRKLEDARAAEELASAKRIAAISVERARKEQEQINQICGPNFAKLSEEASTLLRQGNTEVAVVLVSPCKQYGAATVEMKQFIETVYAADAKRLEKAQKAESAARTVADAKEAAAEKARRRKEGVAIGMTPEEVIASSWGKPQSINRSTYSFGVHEQWVYGSRNYLYFKNGKLDSIQN
jgi:hypothetical protein